MTSGTTRINEAWAEFCRVVLDEWDRAVPEHEKKVSVALCGYGAEENRMVIDAKMAVSHDGRYCYLPDGLCLIQPLWSTYRFQAEAAIAAMTK